MDIAQIQKRIRQINEYKDEIKKSKELIDDQLENNDEYREATKKAKEVAAAKRRIKEEIMNKAENEKIAWDMKEAKEEINTLKQILSTELVEYYQKNNTDEITDENGEKIKFSFSVKLMRNKNSE